MGVLHHALGAGGHGLNVEVGVGADESPDLPQDVEWRTARFGQDGGVGGDAVNGVKLVQLADGVEICVVN